MIDFCQLFQFREKEAKLKPGGEDLAEECRTPTSGDSTSRLSGIFSNYKVSLRSVWWV